MILGMKRPWNQLVGSSVLKTHQGPKQWQQPPITTTTTSTATRTATTAGWDNCRGPSSPTLQSHWSAWSSPMLRATWLLLPKLPTSEWASFVNLKKVVFFVGPQPDTSSHSEVSPQITRDNGNTSSNTCATRVPVVELHQVQARRLVHNHGGGTRSLLQC